MQYELYIDVFFLVNFMMDYLLLRLLNKMLSCTATHVRMTVGAALGAALTCAVVAVPLPCAFVKLLAFHCLANVVMLKIGLKIGRGREFLKAFVFLYVAAFLLGGVMVCFRKYLRVGSMFFALCVLGYLIADGSFSLLEALFRRRSSICRVTMCLGERSTQAKALVDTGNFLKDPINQKAVSVISRTTAERLGIRPPKLSENGGESDEFQNEIQNEMQSGTQKVRFIPCRSIGEANGMLPVYVLDKMFLAGKKEGKEVLAPEIAVCGEELEDREFQVILNPEVYKELS